MHDPEPSMSLGERVLRRWNRDRQSIALVVACMADTIFELAERLRAGCPEAAAGERTGATLYARLRDDPRLLQGPKLGRTVARVLGACRDRAPNAPMPSGLVTTVRSLLRTYHLFRSAVRGAEAAAVKREALRFRPEGFDAYVGQSPTVVEMLHIAAMVAPSNETVLLWGETGTGKEVLARLLHQRSSRNKGSFIVAHGSVGPESLLEDILFGHEKGAFTGASSESPGKLESAHEGTLFLDDLDDMPSAIQVKLLRFLQERTVVRIGGRDEREIDVRIIAATKLDLLEGIRKRRFRLDLFYRLNVLGLVLPPLRERLDDIPLLTHHFLDMLDGDRTFEREDAIWEMLERHEWMGNVRELENVVRRAHVLSAATGVLRPENFEGRPLWTGTPAPAEEPGSTENSSPSVHECLSDLRAILKTRLQRRNRRLTYLERERRGELTEILHTEYGLSWREIGKRAAEGVQPRPFNQRTVRGWEGSGRPSRRKR
jgi:DNA-binding NtrC family response regulator